MEIYLCGTELPRTADRGEADAERALTAEGKEKLRRVLKRAKAKPSLILSSSYRRALETAAIAAEILQSNT